MGTLTFTTIKSEISSHHADRSDISSRLNTVIDLAQIRIARLHDWDQLKFLVEDTLSSSGTLANDKVYDLASSIPSGYKFKNFYSIRVIDDVGRSQKLVGKTQSEFDQYIPEPEWYSRRMPEVYTRVSSIQSGSQVNPALELWPIPDEDYEIRLRFQVWPRFLSDSAKADSDVSDLELDDAIISLATSYLYNSFGREEKARHHFGIYSSIVNNALKLDETDYDTVIAGTVVQKQAVGSYWLDPFIRSID